MALDDLFSQAQNLPNIPKVVQELIDNFNNPDIDADDISKNVQKDQVISAKVMRLANSARYGAGRKINSIDSAVVMLGFDTLKTLVVASGVTGAFKNIPGFDKKAFWRDSFMVASISKQIAKHTSQDREAAFTAGMLHNIGDALIHITYPEKATQINELVASGANKLELQTNQFGFNYCQAGQALADRWNFPDEIQKAIGQHSAPKDFEEFSPLSAIVFLARYLNKALAKDQTQEEIIANVPLDITKSLEIDLVSWLSEIVELTKKEDDIDELLKD